MCNEDSGGPLRWSAPFPEVNLVVPFRAAYYAGLKIIFEHSFFMHSLKTSINFKSFIWKVSELRSYVRPCSWPSYQPCDFRKHLQTPWTQFFYKKLFYPTHSKSADFYRGQQTKNDVDFVTTIQPWQNRLHSWFQFVIGQMEAVVFLVANAMWGILHCPNVS